MRELRIKVDIWVPLPDDAIERAERTLQINDEVERLRAVVVDGLVKSDVKEVIAKTRPRAPRAAPEPTPIERAAAAAAQDSDEERAAAHPIMGDAPDLAPKPTIVSAAGTAEDLLAIPKELDRRVPRPAPGDAR